VFWIWPFLFILWVKKEQANTLESAEPTQSTFIKNDDKNHDTQSSSSSNEDAGE